MTSRSIRRATAVLGAAVAALAAVAAALGAFARGDGTYVTVESVRGEAYEMATTGVYANNALQVVAEGVGWDVFTLVIAVPAMLVAALLAWRGSFRGTVLAAGILGYFVYMYLEYAVTWAFGPLFPLFVGILALSVMGLVGIATLLAGEPLATRFDERFPRRAWVFLSIGMSLMLVVMWAGRIAQGLAGTPELHGETTMTVQALDLGLMVPISLLIAAATWLGSPVGTCGGRRVRGDIRRDVRSHRFDDGLGLDRDRHAPAAAHRHLRHRHAGRTGTPGANERQRPSSLTLARSPRAAPPRRSAPEGSAWNEAKARSHDVHPCRLPRGPRSDSRVLT